MVWAGRILSGLVVVMLILSGVFKLMKPEEIVTEFSRLGYPEHVILVIGILEIACTLIYANPRTAVLGAILVTAYLGGATATHVRIEDSFDKLIGPIVGGILTWLGLYLRDERVRALVPLYSPRS